MIGGVLTKEEVQEISGRKQKAAVIRYLCDRDIPFVTDADGWPRVLRSDAPGEFGPASGGEPIYSAFGSRTPQPGPIPLTRGEYLARLPFIMDAPACLIDEPCVYAMQFNCRGERGLVKIGWSTQPSARRHQIARQEGIRSSMLEMLASCPAPQSMEADMHAALAPFCARGEWFWPEPEVLAVVSAMHHLCWAI